MNLEELFNQNNIIELSFFNFRNAITAAYFANRDLEIRRVNKNFKKFFPILGNVSNAYFPDVLEQLGLPGRQIDEFVTGLNENGSILIPQIEIEIEGQMHRSMVGEEILSQPRPSLLSVLSERCQMFGTTDIE
ncbi:MAG: hypothetical protein RL242_2913 [Pseudomonadota bacterium]